MIDQKTSKIVISMGIIANTLVAIVMSIIIYSLFYPYNPIALKISVAEPNIRIGDEITLNMAGTKNIPVPVSAFIELVDGGNYPIMSYFENNPVGSFIKVKKFIVPNIKPGIYKVRWTGKYKINCIREVAVVVYSNEFYLK